MAHRATLVFAAALLAAGCAGHAARQPMPDVKGPLAVRVSTEPLGSTETPFGVYRFPDTAVYVSGHQSQTRESNLAAVFGVAGGFMASAMAASESEAKTKDARAHLAVDLPALTEQVLAEALARQSQPDRFVAGNQSAGDSLELVPFTVVTFIGESRARLWVGLKATLVDRSGTPRWTTRYHAGADKDRSFAGEGGWASDDGTIARDAIRRNLRLAVDALLDDASGTRSGHVGRAARVTAQWVWFPQMYMREVEVLDESDVVVVVGMSGIAGDSLIGGVNVLDKRSIGLMPSAKK
jgi:hypothetical protein